MRGADVSAATDREIDEVLERAVASGAVPSVAAIAADRNGVIYEAGAGPRVAGERDPVTVDTHHRIMSMTASRATVKQLVTHTAGLTYWFWNADMVNYEATTGQPNVLSGSNEVQHPGPGTGLQMGVRPAVEHRGHPGPPAGLERRLGRPAQHPLLGRPHHRHHGRDLQPVPAVRDRSRAALYQGFESALYASL
jgi:hypothetical protein